MDPIFYERVTGGWLFAFVTKLIMLAGSDNASDETELDPYISSCYLLSCPLYYRYWIEYIP